MLEAVNISWLLVEEHRIHCRRMLWIPVFASLFPSIEAHPYPLASLGGSRHGN